MHEIFVSYRRIDTEASGGHLLADLRRYFGDDSVFMDTRRGGIAWGADWERSLDDALGRCEVLLALVGPQWARCERTPGQRRLDAPDDWVRGEIATVMRLGRPVLPVLFQGAAAPDEDAVPDELRALRFHKLQAYAVSESHWETDTARLFEALEREPRLRQLHDLASSESGIRRLEQLIRDRPEVADAVSRSRAVIETTDREVDEIRLLKAIHDALHEIESKCLIPLRDTAAALPPEGFGRKFAQLERQIRGALAELGALVPELPVLLELDLPSHLAAVGEAFQAAAAAAGDVHARDALVGTLEELVGEIPVRLNDAIDHAATRVQLRQLADLMATVGALLRPAADHDQELRPMLQGIASLDDLRAELARRVREHGVLQSLDNFLRDTVGGQRRAGTAGRIEPATLRADWNHVGRLRARFEPPFSEEVEDGHLLLAALEPAIGEAVDRGDEPEAAARLAAYTNEVGDLFRLVDQRLKEFCFDLRARTRPLKTILDMCRTEARHG